MFPDLQFEAVGEQLRVETRLYRSDGSYLPVMFGATTTGSGVDLQLIVNCVDLSEKKRLEFQLQNAQKLEAVGQLAAGVAHEVNTPIQFINDGVRFLKECVADLATGWTARSELLAEMGARGLLSAADQRALAAIDTAADVDFLFAEAPAAAERTLRGVGRVAEIVRALRAFAHPDGDVCAPADVNSAIRDAASKAELRSVGKLFTTLARVIGPAVVNVTSKPGLRPLAMARRTAGTNSSVRSTTSPWPPKLSMNLAKSGLVSAVADTRPG
jgi:signal transduction histidine kinase